MEELREKLRNEQFAEELGKQLADVLCLKKKRNGFFETLYGLKTYIGLARTIETVIQKNI